MKKLVLEISQNSQDNTCARASFLIKLQDSRNSLLSLLVMLVFEFIQNQSFGDVL